jgi:hypothetical protein
VVGGWGVDWRRAEETDFSAQICCRSAKKAADLRRSAENRRHHLSAFRYLLMVSVEIRNFLTQHFNMQENLPRRSD